MPPSSSDEHYDPTSALEMLLIRAQDPDLASLSELLLSRGADLSQIDFIALHSLIVKGRHEVLDIVLDHAPMELLESPWLSLMTEAVRWSPSIFNDLLARGEGDTPRHAAFRAMREQALGEALRTNQLSIIQTLLEHGLKSPRQPLEDAWLGFARCPKSVDLLIQAGAKPTLAALQQATGLDQRNPFNPILLQSFIEHQAPLHDEKGEPVVWNSLMEIIQSPHRRPDDYRMCLDGARQLLNATAGPRETFKCSPVQMLLALEAGLPPSQVAFSLSWQLPPAASHLPHVRELEYTTQYQRQQVLVECLDQLLAHGAPLDQLVQESPGLHREWVRAMARVGVDVQELALKAGVSPVEIAEGQKARLDRQTQQQALALTRPRRSL